MLKRKIIFGILGIIGLVGVIFFFIGLRMFFFIAENCDCNAQILKGMMKVLSPLFYLSLPLFLVFMPNFLYLLMKPKNKQKDLFGLGFLFISYSIVSIIALACLIYDFFVLHYPTVYPYSMGLYFLTPLALIIATLILANIIYSKHKRKGNFFKLVFKDLFYAIRGKK